MKILKFKLGRPRLAGFARGERGSITVEFVIWMPVFLVILAFIADACLLYLMQADMWNVARDTARRMTTGQLNKPEAETYAKNQLLYSNKPYIVTATQGADDVVEITIPVANASVFGVLAAYGSFTNATLRARVTMRAEI